MVYGSNRIENAGSSFEYTLQLCKAIFRGEHVPDEIEPRPKDYEAALRAFIQGKQQANQPDVIRSRREIVQHAQAFNFIINQIVYRKQLWTEELILQTHAILYKDMDHEDVKPGAYRDHEVAATYVDPEAMKEYEKSTDPNTKPPKEHKSIFIRARSLKKYMEDFVRHLNDDIATATANQTMDPYDLAARYHHQFVNIHPFGHGNGRMSRVILNVLLIAHAGHVSAFGADDETKDSYLDIAHRASKKFHKEDMEVEWEAMSGHHELGRFTLRKSKQYLVRMWECAKTVKGKQGVRSLACF